MDSIKKQRELGADIEQRLNKTKGRRLGNAPVVRERGEIETIVRHTFLGIGVLFSLFVFVAVTWGIFNQADEYEQQMEQPAPIGQEIFDTAQASVIEEAVEYIEEPTPSLSPNSVYNWQYAVDRWNECKNDVSFYQDWVNWYGEESAMRMCIITQSENGSRDPNKVHINDDLSADVGLFQINAYWHCEKIGMPNGNACVEQLKDQDTNLMVARQIYERQGWSPWHGRKAHLPDFYSDRLTIE
jgi:hypothetical protein